MATSVHPGQAKHLQRLRREVELVKRDLQVAMAAVLAGTPAEGKIVLEIETSGRVVYEGEEEDAADQ